jgi:hypothetical protein
MEINEEMDEFNTRRMEEKISKAVKGISTSYFFLSTTLRTHF